MGHHSYHSENSKRNHHQYSESAFYDANSGVNNDLNSQTQFHAQYLDLDWSNSPYADVNHYDSGLDAQPFGQSMLRNDSQSSNSTVYSPVYSPVDGYYYSTSTNDTYSPQPASGTRYPAAASMSWQTPRGGFASYDRAAAVSPSLPMSLGTQQSGTQPDQPARFPCLVKDCPRTTFARQADLDRHYKHKHLSPELLAEVWYCDWSKCLRSENGYHDALARLGQQASSSGSSQKPTGIGPFTRKDHFIAHLREQHQEAIPKSGSRRDPNWIAGKVLQKRWWRCKCLRRVCVQTQRERGGSEYTCGDCGATCDQEVIEARSRQFGGSGGGGGGGGPSGGSGRSARGH